MQDFVTDSVSVGIIDALELVDVQDEKRMKRIRTARPQKFINGGLCMFLIIYSSQSVDLRGMYQLVVVSGVDGCNASDQKNDQEYEIGIQDQLIIVNETVIRVCNGHRNHIAYHPVI